MIKIETIEFVWYAQDGNDNTIEGNDFQDGSSIEGKRNQSDE